MIQSSLLLSRHCDHNVSLSSMSCFHKALCMYNQKSSHSYGNFWTSVVFAKHHSLISFSSKYDFWTFAADAHVVWTVLLKVSIKTSSNLVNECVIAPDLFVHHFLSRRNLNILFIKKKVACWLCNICSPFIFILTLKKMVAYLASQPLHKSLSL